MLSTIKKQILMIGEKPMQTLSDRKAITQTHLQNIPPVVYQTWEVDFATQASGLIKSYTVDRLEYLPGSASL
jgi:hypothetical protein